MATDLTAMIALARRLYVDTDTTDPALSTADLTALINEAYLKWHESVEPRYQTGVAFVVGATAVSAMSNANTYAEFGALTVGSVGSTYRTIEQVDYNTIQDKLSEDGSTTSDVPQMCSLRREQTDTEANQGLWTVNVWPRSAAGYNITAQYRKTPAALSAGTDEPDVSEEARYTIARIVAATAAYLVGEGPDFVATILQPVPEHIQSAMGVARLHKRPRGGEQAG